MSFTLTEAAYWDSNGFCCGACQTLTQTVKSLGDMEAAVTIAVFGTVWDLRNCAIYISLGQTELHL